MARVYSLLRLKQFTDELDNAESVLFSLALAIEAKDPYTEGHCDRLSKYSVALAEKLGLPDELLTALRRGASQMLFCEPRSYRIDKRLRVVGEYVPGCAWRMLIGHHHIGDALDE